MIERRSIGYVRGRVVESRSVMKGEGRVIG